MSFVIPLAEAGIGDIASTLGAILLVIGLAAALYYFAGWLRERLKQNESGPPGGFDLGSLRQLVKEGKMTQMEFERAKAKILDATKRATAVPPAHETTSPKQFPPRT